MLLEKSVWLFCNKKEIINLLTKLFTIASGGLLLRIIPFLITPIILKIISPEQYGVIALLQSFISFAVLFNGFGLRQVLYINFYHMTAIQRKEMINNIVIIYLFCSLPMLLISFLARRNINSYFFKSYVSDELVGLVLIICFLIFFSELYYQVLALSGKTTKLICVQVSIAFVTTICNLILIIMLRLGCTGIFLSNFFSILLALIFGASWYYQCNGYHYFDIHKANNNFKEYFSIALPFIPSMFFGWVLSSSGRWFLAHYSTLYDVGIYSLADTFGQLYQVLVMLPINNGYLPYLMQKFSENLDNIMEIEIWNRKIMYLFLSIMILITSLGYLILHILLKFILPVKYYEILHYIQYILLANICWTGTSFTLALVFFMKRTYPYLLTLFISCIFNIVLNLILVPNYKIGGCAWATMLSYLIYFLLTIYCNYQVQREVIVPSPVKIV